VPRFVEVIVTTGAPQPYTYRVPPPLDGRVVIGARVLVPLRNQKVTGVVLRGDVTPPPGVRMSDVSEVLDGDAPALTGELLDLCAWMAEYYEAALGEVVKAALPVGTGVGARVVIALTETGQAAVDGEGAALPDKQRDALSRLARGPLAVTAVGAKLKAQLEPLIARGLVEEREERDEARVRPKREQVVALAVGVDVAALTAIISRAPKRRAVLAALGASAAGGAMAIAELERQVPGARAALKELAKAGYVTLGEREAAVEAVAIGSAVTDAFGGGAIPTLTDEQARAVGEIVDAMRAGAAAEPTTPPTADGARPKFVPFLLHGVTGSGKTEVYLRVIAETLAMGRTALVLVPEISLTPQLAARFRARFGDLVAILHSGLSESQRLAEWTRLRRGEASIAVGARSAVFAPLSNLGAIVVDEEHDGSFKQDESVKYHARDVALVRAQRAGAICVLGSATPSLESYAHAERGTYRRLVLAQRPTARSAMPVVDIVDLRTYLADGDAMLSAPLRTALVETLAAGDQAILFLNRRGFATFVLCRACGYSFRCKHCSVSMTYHRYSDRLSCHYCNASAAVPDTCPDCKTTGAIERKGLGTEKVADAIALEMPTARVARLDRDVATGSKIEAILGRVARREIDVLVGTQMVTKGHDFPGVTLVGVLCADTGLTLPDFRASERTYQLLAQVAGRAGRGERAGRVIVQTYRPTAPAVVAAAAHDYGAFFAAESEARAELGYPPHGRLIAVRIDGKQSAEVVSTANRLAQLAEMLARRPECAGVEVRGPVPAPIERLRERTRWQIWLRAADRHALRRVARGVAAAEPGAGVRVGLDVDPMSAL
jgi:primosomal protein N' (replication factor Y)